MAVERTQKWDILKFFLIITVVVGHLTDFYLEESGALKALCLGIYVFHMPLFIFVSGLFAKRTVNEKRKDKIAGYLALYFVIKFILWLYSSIRYEKMNFRVLSEGGLPWFMFALFAFMLITIAVKDFSPRYVLPMSILVACLAGFDNSLGAYLSLSRIIVFYPFFYAGYILDPKKIEEHSKKPAAKVAAAFILIAFITLVVLFGEEYYSFRPLLTGINPFSTLGEYAKYGFMLRLAAYALAALTGYAFIVLTPGKTPLGIAAKYGRRTLSVYALHYIFIYILFYSFDIRTALYNVSPVWDEWLAMLLAIPIIFVCSLGVFDKIFSKIAVVPLKK